ncbi:hypothetical protein [Mycobacterium ahvazicum]|uniref:hypothetical protein n=1 Tax=Mycobacterium ahvazicum TaxID=1964395 RepID=UPI000BB80B46|nr:hypothetical protein [Mycobacterium ahvazicum]
MSAPPTVAHHAFELSAAVLVREFVATWTACVGVEFASTGSVFSEFDVFAPLGQVAQRSAVVAGPASTVRVHPREMAVASSGNLFTSERRDVARSVIGQP